MCSEICFTSSHAFPTRVACFQVVSRVADLFLEYLLTSSNVSSTLFLTCFPEGKTKRAQRKQKTKWYRLKKMQKATQTLFQQKNVFSSSALSGTKTIVVGGTQGIGLAVARMVVASGGEVWIGGRNQDKMQQAIEDIGEGAHGFNMDSTNEQSVIEQYEKFKNETFNHLVLSSGGAGPSGEFLNQDLA